MSYFNFFLLLLELTVYYIYKRFFYEENMDGNKYGFFFSEKN